MHIKDRLARQTFHPSILQHKNLIRICHIECMKCCASKQQRKRFSARWMENIYIDWRRVSERVIERRNESMPQGWQDKCIQPASCHNRVVDVSPIADSISPFSVSVDIPMRSMRLLLVYVRLFACVRATNILRTEQHIMRNRTEPNKYYNIDAIA